MNTEMPEHLGTGGLIDVSIVIEATVEIDGVAAALDMKPVSSSRRMTFQLQLASTDDRYGC